MPAAREAAYSFDVRPATGLGTCSGSPYVGERVHERVARRLGHQVEVLGAARAVVAEREALEDVERLVADRVVARHVAQVAVACAAPRRARAARSRPGPARRRARRRPRSQRRSLRPPRRGGRRRDRRRRSCAARRPAPTGRGASPGPSSLRAPWAARRRAAAARAVCGRARIASSREAIRTSRFQVTSTPSSAARIAGAEHVRPGEPPGACVRGVEPAHGPGHGDGQGADRVGVALHRRASRAPRAGGRGSACTCRRRARRGARGLWSTVRKRSSAAT